MTLLSAHIQFLVSVFPLSCVHVRCVGTRLASYAGVAWWAGPCARLSEGLLLYFSSRTESLLPDEHQLT
jgi:hypothetical protein